MDRIVIPEIPLQAHVGVTAEERASAQELLIDVVLHLDLRDAGGKDDFAKTVDYDSVYATAEEVVGSRAYRLIEAVAEELARALLRSFAVEAVDLRVKKPGALAARGVPYAAVEIHRRRDG